MFPVFLVQSQFMAYLYDDGGMYIGCHDQNKNVKQIDFYHKDERVKLQLRFYSGVNYGEDFAMNFDVVFRFFKGEWQDACEIYRAWYETVSDVKRAIKDVIRVGTYVPTPDFIISETALA